MSRVVSLQPRKTITGRQLRRKLTPTTKPRFGNALRSSGFRVVVRAEPGVYPEEELIVLGVLRELKERHDALRLEYVTENEEIYDLLPNAWFLSKSHLDPCTPEIEQLEPGDFFDKVAGDDVGITLFEPDPQAIVIAEQAQYQKRYERALEEAEARQRFYQEKGMKDIKVPIPENTFQPKWHRSNGYLWTISDQLGLNLEIPTEPITPFGETYKGLRRDVWKNLAKMHVSDRPFGVYDFRFEGSEIAIATALSQTMGHLNWISIQGLERTVGGGIANTLAALCHENCRMVITPINSLAVCAWAAQGWRKQKVRKQADWAPYLMSLYTGSNASWDGVHAANEYVLARDAYTDEQMPVAVAEYAKFLEAHSRGFING